MGPKGTRIIIMIIYLIDVVIDRIRAVHIEQLFFKPFSCFLAVLIEQLEKKSSSFFPGKTEKKKKNSKRFHSLENERIKIFGRRRIPICGEINVEDIEIKRNAQKKRKVEIWRSPSIRTAQWFLPFRGYFVLALKTKYFVHLTIVFAI